MKGHANFLGVFFFSLDHRFENSSWCNVIKKEKKKKKTQSVGRRALGCEVAGSNLPLPAVLEVTLGGHSSNSVTIQGVKLGLAWAARVDSEVPFCASESRELVPPWL